MNSSRMTPAELCAIIDAAGITTKRAAEMASVGERALVGFSVGDPFSGTLPAPASRLLCIHLLFEGLAVDLARPWVPDDLAAVLAPKMRDAPFVIAIGAIT